MLDSLNGFIQLLSATIPRTAPKKTARDLPKREVLDVMHPLILKCL